MTIGFLNDVYEKKREREELVGKWVVFYLSNGHTPAGRVIRCTDEKIYLKPFQFGRYNKKGFVSKLVGRESYVKEFQIIGMNPTTKKSLENSCLIQNKENSKKKESLKRLNN